METEAIKNQMKPLIDSIISEEDLRNVTYDVKSGSKVGDNYVGVIYRVVLKGEKNNGEKIKKSLIYKCQPESEARRKQFNTEVFFKNEAVFYNDVLPAFIRFLDDKGLKDEFKSFPNKCYSAGESLLVEDMCQYGFTMHSRLKALDMAHCRLVLKELGKLHAISFALRDQQPEEFKRLSDMVKTELIFRDDPIMKIHGPACVEKATEKFMNTSKLPHLENYKKVLDKLKSEYLESMIETVKGENAEPYAVINHGDCWTNNLLFKYSEGSTTPVELCMIDFQIARYSSPVNDVVYLLYCCTDQSMRHSYYNHLIKEYYSSLSTFLTQLGSNPDKLFPFSVLQDQLQRFSKFGFGMALLTIPLFTCQAEDLPDFNALEGDADPTMMMNFQNTNEDISTSRMNGVIEEMVDNKYII